MRRGTLAALLATASLAACAAPPPPNYYRLAAVPGAPRATSPAGVALRGIGLPGFLGQTNIAKPSGPLTFDTHGNDLWAAPLPDLLQGAMVVDLGQRLPDATVIAIGGAIAAPRDVTIEINILGFDPNANGVITLTAQYAVKFGADAASFLTRNFSASASPAGPAVSDEVAAMSTLWGQLADQIAAALPTSPGS